MNVMTFCWSMKASYTGFAGTLKPTVKLRLLIIWIILDVYANRSAFASVQGLLFGKLVRPKLVGSFYDDLHVGSVAIVQFLDDFLHLVLILCQQFRKFVACHCQSVCVDIGLLHLLEFRIVIFSDDERLEDVPLSRRIFMGKILLIETGIFLPKIL